MKSGVAKLMEEKEIERLISRCEVSFIGGIGSPQIVRLVDMAITYPPGSKAKPLWTRLALDYATPTTMPASLSFLLDETQQSLRFAFALGSETNNCFKNELLLNGFKIYATDHVHVMLNYGIWNSQSQKWKHHWKEISGPVEKSTNRLELTREAMQRIRDVTLKK